MGKLKQHPPNVDKYYVADTELHKQQEPTGLVGTKQDHEEFVNKRDSQLYLVF